jgi:hypothetical protein
MIFLKYKHVIVSFNMFNTDIVTKILIIFRMKNNYHYNFCSTLIYN